MRRKRVECPWSTCVYASACVAPGTVIHGVLRSWLHVALEFFPGVYRSRPAACLRPDNKAG